MARRFAQKKQLFGEPDEKTGDATSGRDHEVGSKTLEGGIYPAEVHICRGKLQRRGVCQGNISNDAANVE